MLAQRPRPAVQPLVQRLELGLGRDRERRRRSSRSAASARRRGRATDGRAARAPPAASASPSAAGVPNTLPEPLITAGTPSASSSSWINAALPVRADEDGDIARARPARGTSAARRGRRRSISAPRAEQRDDVGGEVTRDEGSRRRRRSGSRWRFARPTARRRRSEPHAQRRVTGAPSSRGDRVAGRCLHLPVDDLRVPEPRVAEERVESVEQRAGRCGG